MNTGSSNGVPPGIPADIDKTPAALVELLLRNSLESGICVDTRFYVYSRKKPSGVVFAPRAVYANSWILRAKLASYFEPLLLGSFQRDVVVGPLDSAFPERFRAETELYDYDSDSDLEDGEDDEYSAPPSDSTHQTSTPSMTEIAASNKDVGDDGAHPVASETRESVLGNGKTVLIASCAHSTWKALVFYIYTGKITFSPLKSRKTSSVLDIATQPPSLGTHSCSPKSMYRLADMLGFAELRTRALASIKSQLSSEIILDELFSLVSARYSAVSEMEIDYACTAQVRAALSKRITGTMGNMGAEDLKRSASVISRIMVRLCYVPPPPPPPTPPPVVDPRPSQCTFCHALGPRLKCGSCNSYL